MPVTRLCARLAAEEAGAKVLVLEAATEELGGGNTRFTAGAIRTVYNGVDDLRDLMPDLTDAECEITDLAHIPKTNFLMICSELRNTGPTQNS